MGFFKKIFGSRNSQSEFNSSSFNENKNSDYVYVVKDNNSNEIIKTKNSINKQKTNTKKDNDFLSYQKTLFLYSLSFYTKPIEDNGKYKRYLIYECKINNPQNFHKKMIAENYLELATKEETINTLTVSELKQILKSNALPVSGKKEILINRIKENIDLENLTFNDQQKRYTLSDKGKQYLKKHYEFVLLHNHNNWDINFKEYINRKNRLGSKYSFYDVCWSIFNERIIKYRKYSDADLLRNNFFDMYNLLLEENKPEQAIYYLLLTIYYDLSGMEFYEQIKTGMTPLYDKELYSNLTKRIRDPITGKEKIINITEENFYDNHFPMNIIKKLGSLKSYYNKSIIDDIYSKYKLPISCCSSEMFKDIISDFYNNPKDFNECKYRDKLVQNLKHYCLTHK